jgi:hypothetical protein
LCDAASQLVDCCILLYSSSCALASTAHEQLWLLYLAGYPTPRGPEPYPSSLWADLLQVHSSCVLVAQDNTTVYTPHTTTQHSWGIMLGKGDMRQSGHTMPCTPYTAPYAASCTAIMARNDATRLTSMRCDAACDMHVRHALWMAFLTQ